MLTILRDADNRIEAACDWWLVDEHGWWEPKGRYVFINQIEVNTGVNLHRLRRYLVRRIGSMAPDAIGVYWERRDKCDAHLHAFKRTQLAQLKEEVMV